MMITMTIIPIPPIPIMMRIVVNELSTGVDVGEVVVDVEEVTLVEGVVPVTDVVITLSDTVSLNVPDNVLSY